jgi:hypothetical protein
MDPDVGDGPPRPTHEPERDIGEIDESAPLTHTANCAHHESLYGMDDGSHTGPTLGPLTVDTTGLDICLTLDARDNLLVAHFAATMHNEPSTSSSFRLSLYDADGNLLRDGWDVTYGIPAESTHASLEHGIEKGQLVDAVLWVRAKTGTATSPLRLYLFEPFE